MTFASGLGHSRRVFGFTGMSGDPPKLAVKADIADRQLRAMSRSHRSFCLDPSRLDDRPPFVDLGLLQRAKRLGRLLVARRQLLTELGQPALHHPIGKSLADRAIEHGDDICRRAFWGPEPVPDRRVEARQPRLVDSRDLGPSRQARLCGDRKGLIDRPSPAATNWRPGRT